MGNPVGKRQNLARANTPSNQQRRNQ